MKPKGPTATRSVTNLEMQFQENLEVAAGWVWLDLINNSDRYSPWLKNNLVINFSMGAARTPTRAICKAALLRHVRFEGHGAFLFAGLGRAAGFLEEVLLGSEFLFAGCGLQAFGGAVGQDPGGLGVVLEEGL